jgi:hypothetical protein
VAVSEVIQDWASGVNPWLYVTSVTSSRFTEEFIGSALPDDGNSTSSANGEMFLSGLVGGVLAREFAVIPPSRGFNESVGQLILVHNTDGRSASDIVGVLSHAGLSIGDYGVDISMCADKWQHCCGNGQESERFARHRVYRYRFFGKNKREGDGRE